MSTLVISRISLSFVPTFQHILHRSIDFKLVFDYCYCYPCWSWCTKFNSPMSLNFNILHLSNNTSVTTYFHRMIISPPCLFKHIKNDERVVKLYQGLLEYTQQKLYFCLVSLLGNNVWKGVYINLRHSVQVTEIIIFNFFNMRISKCSARFRFWCKACKYFL